MTGDARAELESLLGETSSQAAERLRAASLAGSSIVLYGAGTLGRRILRRLRAAGVEPLAFADDTPEKQGMQIDGVPVMTAQAVLDTYGTETIFVVTILNPMLDFLGAKRRLQTSNPQTCVISYLDLAWAFPEAFLPFDQFEAPEVILTKRDAIRRAFDLFEDEESRRQFVAHVRFRLRLDHEGLPASTNGDYFPADLIPELPGDTTFVDCGAYDGDTVRAFLERQDNRFAGIYAFEPDESNYQKLQAYVDALDRELAARVHLVKAGVGSRRERLRFAATGNMGAALSKTGDVEIDIVPIHDIVEGDAGAPFIKYDVEGAELEGLRGAERLIADGRTTLAVSIYHRPDDLWELPLVMHTMMPQSKFALRTLGTDGMDVICYALPADR